MLAVNPDCRRLGLGKGLFELIGLIRQKTRGNDHTEDEGRGS
jgi:hypothetical protein